MQAAKREGLEELRINLPRLKRLAKYESKTNFTFRTLYLAHYDGSFNPNKKEVEYAEFMALTEIKQRIKVGDLYTNGFKKDIEFYEKM